MHGKKQKSHILGGKLTTRSLLAFLYSCIFVFDPLSATSPVLIFDSHGLCFCVRMYVCFCTWSVCCHRHTRRSRRAVRYLAKSLVHSRSHKSSIQSVQQQRYNGSRAPSSRLCGSSHDVCVRLVHSRSLNHDNTSGSNAPVKHKSSDLIPGIRSIQQQQKQYRSSYLAYGIGTSASLLFYLRRPRDIQLTLSRRGTSFYNKTCNKRPPGFLHRAAGMKRKGAQN